MREMKDSGIEWIGKIPADWTLQRGKTIFAQRLTKGNQSEILLAATQKYGMLPQSEVEGVVQVKEDADLQQFRTVHKKDFVISLRSFQGGFEYSQYEGVCSPAYQVFYNTNPICHNYYRLLFKSDGFIQKMNSMTVGIREGKNIQYSDFANSLIPVPPINQQQHIADYLDRKCSQIDAIIAQQQEVIEKLKAYKLSVITETVTKGLNPDVPMKDSGVEWIGEIPEHWKMVRLKFLLSHIIDCPHETPIYSAYGDYLVIRTADQDLGKLRAAEDMYRLDAGEYQNRIRRMPLEKDDIVYGREGERWGLACLVPESNKYCLGQRMLQFRCKRELFLPRFAMWALNSKFVYLQGAVDTIGSTSPHVNISTVRNFLIPVPNINEQQEIIEYVDKKMLQLDKEVEHREMLIRKLNGYKKSLIYEVVTGKKEVQ